MRSWTKKLDVAANVLIVLSCVLVLGLLAQKYLRFDKMLTDQDDKKLTLVDKALDLKEVNWLENQKTLVLFLRKDCHFCKESEPFYQRLVRETATQNKVRLVAVFPHPVNESKQYLQERNLDIPTVLQSSLTDVGVRGTPTVLLVNEKGLVTREWLGKLPPSGETDLLTTISQ